jgi:Protein of unknown function (DUF2490)
MHSILKKRFWSTLITGSTLPVCLLSTDVRAQNSSNQMWYTYNHQAIVSKKWGYMFDLNHRTTNFKSTSSVLSAARVGATYLFDRNHRLTAGYAWFGTHTEGLKGNTLTENRLWEQYQVFKQPGKTSFFHRVRTEQRWRELAPQNGGTHGKTAFSFRARYMYQHQGPIWPITEERKFGVWWQGATEIMLHSGDGIDKHYFDQLRIIGGFILMPSKNLNLAVLYQYINQYRPATEQAYNIHTIRLTLLHQIDFSAHKKTNGSRPLQRDE